MHIEAARASVEDKPLILRMLELYQYDFSEFEGTDLDAHGCFGYPYLDMYWLEPTRHPFLLPVDGRLAGFVLVNQKTYLESSEWGISEFFILRKYRRKGVGKSAAFSVFEEIRGKWEVHELQGNGPSQAFWREIIAEYTGGKSTEVQWDGGASEGPIQCFDHSLVQGKSQGTSAKSEVQLPVRGANSRTIRAMADK